MALRLYNTMTRRTEDFIPADPARVTFYSCGLTVYDYGHIGNFRTFLAADVLRRWIESPLCELRTADGGTHRGPRRVVHVMNVTDVGHMTDDADADGAGEDKMQAAGRRLLEAKKAGKLPAGVSIDPGDPYAIARFYEDAFKTEARKLGLKVVSDADRDPTLMPRATESVPAMIEVIKRLIERGYAYASGPAGMQTVYFDVQKFAPYGRLSGNTLERLRSGAGGRVSEANQAQKRHPADFLLWKADPSHIMKWPSPWGAGYPGWHIECTAMSTTRLLGSTPLRGAAVEATLSPDQLARVMVADGEALIDLHSGGEDNIFPHHECEVAQSCGAFNASPEQGTFARLWFHSRFLLVDGEKMSKSKGNFYTVSDLFNKGYEPAAVRLALIGTHYRSNANLTLQGLTDAQRTVDRWRRFAEMSSPLQQGQELPDGSRAIIAEFAEALNNDLNVAEAIALINIWMGRVGESRRGDADVLRAFDAVLGLLELERPAAAQTDIGLFAPGVEPDPRVVEKLIARRDARAAKDFKRSDAIRDELLTMGFAIKDVPGGKVEVRRA